MGEHPCGGCSCSWWAELPDEGRGGGQGPTYSAAPGTPCDGGWGRRGGPGPRGPAHSAVVHTHTHATRSRSRSRTRSERLGRVRDPKPVQTTHSANSIRGFGGTRGPGCRAAEPGTEGEEGRKRAEIERSERKEEGRGWWWAAGWWSLQPWLGRGQDGIARGGCCRGGLLASGGAGVADLDLRPLA